MRRVHAVSLACVIVFAVPRHAAAALVGVVEDDLVPCRVVAVGGDHVSAVFAFQRDQHRTARVDLGHELREGEDARRTGRGRERFIRRGRRIRQRVADGAEIQSDTVFEVVPAAGDIDAVDRIVETPVCDGGEGPVVVCRRQVVVASPVLPGAEVVRQTVPLRDVQPAPSFAVDEGVGQLLFRGGAVEAFDVFGRGDEVRQHRGVLHVVDGAAVAAARIDRDRSGDDVRKGVGHAVFGIAVEVVVPEHHADRGGEAAVHVFGVRQGVGQQRVAGGVFRHRDGRRGVEGTRVYGESDFAERFSGRVVKHLSTPYVLAFSYEKIRLFPVFRDPRVHDAAALLPKYAVEKHTIFIRSFGSAKKTLVLILYCRLSIMQALYLPSDNIFRPVRPPPPGTTDFYRKSGAAGFEKRSKSTYISGM